MNKTVEGYLFVTGTIIFFLKSQKIPVKTLFPLKTSAYIYTMHAAIRYLSDMKLFRKIIPFLILAGVAGTTLSGCFIFKPKNKCGTCPTFSAKKKKVKH
jgi:hypothetical protein